MAIQWRLMVVAVVHLGACSDEPSRAVHFTDLDEGEVIGGPQVTSVETDIPAGALRMDLFLDDERIGSAEMAPFSFAWNTTSFDEGGRELRARVETTDGAVFETVVGVVLDNTPPVVEPLPESIVAGQLIQLRVTDEHAIVRIELDAGSFRESWAGLPAEIAWPDGCGPGDVLVTATDEAGWSSSVASAVTSSRPDDRDCDGHLTLDAVGGTDCDDLDAAVNPDATDLGPLGDVNCDGVPGTDADLDGVASLGMGGRDCDDLDPASHPGATIYRGSRPLEIDGEAVSWEPGTAAGSVGSTDQGFVADLAINRTGAVELLAVDVNRAEVIARTDLLTGVNPGKVLLAHTHDDVLRVVYAYGGEVRQHVRRDGVWSDELILVADGDIDDMVADVTAFGGGVLVRAGGALHLAIQTDGGWESRLVDPGAAVEPAPIGFRFSYDGVSSAAYVVDGALRLARIPDLGEPVFRTLGAVPDPSSMIAVCIDPDVDVAYYADGGCLMRSGDPADPVVEPCGAPIERVFCLGEAVAFQPAEGVVGLYEDGALEYIQVDGAEMAGRLRESGGHVFAAPGAFFGREGYVESPPDPVDGVDRDCDGIDG